MYINMAVMIHLSAECTLWDRCTCTSGDCEIRVLLISLHLHPYSDGVQPLALVEEMLLLEPFHFMGYYL